MTTLSKLLADRSGFISLINMSFLHELYQNNVTVPVVGTIFFCVISYYLMKWLNNDVNVPVRDATKNHNWKPIKITAKVSKHTNINFVLLKLLFISFQLLLLQAWYCSICEALLLNGIGVYCDCCGVCSDADCVKKANVILTCKEAMSNKDVQVHHWVKGIRPIHRTQYSNRILIAQVIYLWAPRAVCAMKSVHWSRVWSISSVVGVKEVSTRSVRVKWGKSAILDDIVI